MVAFIVMVVMVASVIRAAIGGGRSRRHRRDEAVALQDSSAENARLRDEVTRLMDRVAVLERIVTDKNQLLEQEFERLRDR